MKPKNVRIMMTGGHITPAIATIEEIRSRFPDWKVVFVGRKYALEGAKVVSEECRLIKDMDIRFLPIIAGRLKREGSLSTLVTLCKVPVGLVQACLFVLREKPDMIVSFGGYVALPVALSARVFGVPIVTHEQTTRLGLANRIIAWVATKICISFPDTAKIFSKKDRVVMTGLPIRKDVLTPPLDAPFSLPSPLPILLVVGGSTGSVSVNEAVFAALPELLKTYNVIHQVGRYSNERSQKIISSLPENLRNRYVVQSYLSPREYSWALHACSLVIGRSGANTVTEIALVGAISICIPLPWSANNEQLYNAKELVKYGSVILPQKKLSSKTLITTIESVMANIDERKAMAVRASETLPHDGAKRFVDVIEHCLLAPQVSL